MAAALDRKAGLPAVTFLVVAAGLALALLPDAAALFVYDRDRVLDGEVWRLVTGHAVHFSWTHAGWNLALFAVAGGWLERAQRAGYLWLLALTALASGLYFAIGLPEMARYGGLSGLVSAAVVTLCLTGMRHGGFVRAIWAAVLLLFAAKVGYEILAGQALFATPGAIPFQVAPAAHIIGAAVAVALFYSSPGGAAVPIQTCRATRCYRRVLVSVLGRFGRFGRFGR